jgi:hypothetical protein
MSHALRAAVAAASLLTLPACVPIGIPGPNSPGALQTATNPDRSGSAALADEPSGTTSRRWASAGNLASLGGTQTLLAWAQSQAGIGTTRGQNMVFEQSDSRLRLVLNMLDGRSAGGLSGGASGVMSLGVSGEAWHPAAAALWLAPTGRSADEFGLDRARVTLGGPSGEGLGDLIALQVAEMQNTPEPGTLALVGAGVCVLGAVRRLRRA